MTSERRETNEANPKIALVFCLQQQQKEGQPKQSQQSHRVQVTELRIYGVWDEQDLQGIWS